MEAVEAKSVLNRVPELLDVPYPRIWTVYDKEADVLYLNFKKPSHADDSELTDDDLIIRYEKRSVVGITVLNVSRRRSGYGRRCLSRIRKLCRLVYGIAPQFQESSIIEQKEESITHANLKLSY